jgi:hypothetical protein
MAQAGANAEQVRQGRAWVFERYAPRDSPLYTIQQLKLRKFGGDFEALVEWWRENKVVEHQRLDTH